MSLYKQEVKQTLALAWPCMGAHVLHQVMLMVDTMMVGRLGTSQLASMAMALPLISFVTTFSIGVLSIVSAHVSHAMGEKKTDAVEACALKGIWTALGLSFLILGVFYLSGSIFKLCGQDPLLIPDAVSFIRGFSWGLPFYLLFVAFRQLTEGSGYTRPSLVVSMIGLVANIILDYVFIFGHAGFPVWGIWGAGFATACVDIMLMVSLLLYIQFSPNFKWLHLWKNKFTINLKSVWLQFMKGLPFGGMIITEVGIFAFATLFIGTFGKIALAGHQIALNVASLSFMMAIGLASAVGIRAAWYHGAKDFEGVKRMGKVSLNVTLWMMSIPAVVFLLFPTNIARLYTSDPEVIHSAAWLIRIAGIFQLVDGSQAVSSGLLRGLKDSKIPFLNSLFSFTVVGFLSIFVFAKIFHLQETGVWMGLTLTLATAAVLHRWRFRQLLLDNT